MTPQLPGALTPEELARALRKVAADYEAFTAREPLPGTHEDAKGFSAHHAAARSALSHLEHLMKLGRAGGEAGEEAEALVAAARRAIVAAGPEDAEGGETEDDAA